MFMSRIHISVGRQQLWSRLLRKPDERTRVAVDSAYILWYPNVAVEHSLDAFSNTLSQMKHKQSLMFCRWSKGVIYSDANKVTDKEPKKIWNKENRDTHTHTQKNSSSSHSAINSYIFYASYETKLCTMASKDTAEFHSLRMHWALALTLDRALYSPDKRQQHHWQTRKTIYFL